jgi:hypothetical protein
VVLLCHVEIAGAVELNDLVAGAPGFIGISHTRQSLADGRFFLLLGLRDRVARSGTLIW